MPSYNSDRGKWIPAQEDVYVNYADSKFRANKGRKSFHHNGPDRAATEELKTAGEEFFGTDVENDPQMMEVAQKYNLTVPQYLDRFKPNSKQEAIKKEADEKVNDHSLPVSKPGVQPQGGGVTTRGAISDDMPV